MAIFHDEGHKEHDPDVEIQSVVVGKYQDTEHVKFKTVPPIQIASATYSGRAGKKQVLVQRNMIDLARAGDWSEQQLEE